MKLMMNDFMQYWAITTTDSIKGLMYSKEDTYRSSIRATSFVLFAWATMAGQLSEYAVLG